MRPNHSRPFSASAGATVLVTGLVVVSYILKTLRPLVPEAIVTLDWRLPPAYPGRLMLFEAFVTDQRKTAATRHIEDAHLAIAGMNSQARPIGLPAGEKQVFKVARSQLCARPRQSRPDRPLVAPGKATSCHWRETLIGANQASFLRQQSSSLKSPN
jgi:hypothetical protein